jgi:hypothetical protein
VLQCSTQVRARETAAIVVDADIAVAVIEGCLFVFAEGFLTSVMTAAVAVAVENVIVL